MIAHLFKPLTLSLAVTLTLGACKPEQPPTPPPAETNAAAPAPAPADELPPLMRLQASELDTSVNACTDFGAFVNNKWLAANQIPADRATWGSLEVLDERSLAVQKQLAEQTAAATGAQGVGKLVGDLWATGMDAAKVEAAGLTPIQPMLEAIAALKSGEEVAGYLREIHAKGQGLLFGFGANADFKQPDMNIAYATQGGLGLPDKTYYFDADKQDKRDAYAAHIAKVLELSGIQAGAAAEQAKTILAFETRLAQISKSREELSRDVSLWNNPVDIAQADAISPNFKWSAFFESQGLARPAKFSLAMPDFHKQVSAMLGDLPVADWQAYLRFHTVDALSPYLSDAFAQERFNFYGKALSGQKQIEPRWKRVLETVNDEVGEALGQLYVRDNFPPESKARMQALVKNLSDALKLRLENLDWMGAETKAKAIQKWASFTPKIGYPDKWRDWSGLSTSRDSYVGNVLAATEFNYRWDLGKIGKPVDRAEWGMTPQTVNAYYNPLQNEVVFPAAILQPPYFDPQGDDALNYGGIGAVIGHEMIHGYDDQGSRFDASGKFENWWSKQDRADFESRTGKLDKQFDDYVAIDDQHVNGNLTLGENIADLGGLTVAFAAMKRAQGENFQAPKIDGYTQEQRFYMNWAAVWRRNFMPDELKKRLKSDSHAPAYFRAIGAPSNIPSFAEAFGCNPGDPMMRADDARVLIW